MFGWLVAAGAVGALIYFDPAKRESTAPVDAGEPPRPVVAIDAGIRRVETIEPDARAIAGDALAIDAASLPEAPALYTVDEALSDLAAGPLVFIGTGEWYGNYSIHGCAYRNARVIVVNVYCTVKEQPAFSVVVLSPARGRLRIYAEAGAPISTTKRSDYIEFRAEVERPDPADPIALGISYADLRAWDERRHHSGLGACWAGDGEGCSNGLEPSLAAWLPSAKAFLDAPPAAFQQLAKDLHARAVRDSQRSK